MTWILALILIFASSFPYLFVGPLPLWIFFGLCAFGWAIKKRIVPAVFLSNRILFFLICSWLGLLLLTSILDATTLQSRDLMAGPGLNFLSLLVFLGVLSGALVADRKRILRLVFALALLQGSIAILQFWSVPGMWALPDTISNSLGTIARVDTADIADLEFLEALGRARGTHAYIHIFNAVLSCISAFCLFLTFHSESKISLGERSFRITATLIAITGVLLTFSRSGVLTILLATLTVLFFRPRIGRWATIGISILTALAFANLVGLFDAEAIARILDFNVARTTNASRLDHLREAIETFSNSPWTGESGQTWQIDRSLPIHSVLLRFLNDYGLLGLAPYSLVVINFFLLFFKISKNGAVSARIWAGCGLAVVAAVLADSWTHSSGFLRKDVIHAIMLGLVAGFAFQERMERV
jgi:hypothetical protein